MILKRENEREEERGGRNESENREEGEGRKVRRKDILLVASFFSKLFSREFGLNVPKFAVRTIIRSGIPQFAGPKGRTAVSIRREIKILVQPGNIQLRRKHEY